MACRASELQSISTSVYVAAGLAGMSVQTLRDCASEPGRRSSARDSRHAFPRPFRRLVCLCSNEPGAAKSVPFSQKRYFGLSSVPKKAVKSMLDPLQRETLICTGTQPCSLCAKADVECIYDLTKDTRRDRQATHQAVKRRLEDLEQDVAKYQRLVGYLGRCQSPEADAVTSLLRSHASAEEVIHYMNSDTTFLDSALGGNAQVFRKAVSDYADDLGQPLKAGTGNALRPSPLISTTGGPPIEVPAKPWTDVIDSDELVSYLVSIYFTWMALLVPVIEQDSFIDAMKSQKLDSVFCSRSVVNAICASACVRLSQ
ncbi:MAG: hypothetical protein Q9159_004885 [Coniocarpon cinnabarinum]